MDIRSCEVFLKLAETQHFARTAVHCNLSPSAVSRQVQRLELVIGEVLVDRDNRHVRLTDAGQRFAEYARKAVDDWRQLLIDLNRQHSSLRGTVSVFGSVTASYSVLTQILPRTREAHPGLEIKLRTGDQADGVKRVLDGIEDSAIIAKPDSMSSRLAFLPLTRTPLRLIGPRTPSALSRELDAHIQNEQEPDWATLPMVLAETGLARKRLLERLQARRQKPDIYAQVAGHEAVVSMVSLGFGLAVVPELVIQHSPKQETIRVLPWLTDLKPFELGLCTLTERHHNVLLRAFRAVAAATYPQS
jgi:LysR family transcriptional regulator, positive regulator for ilvC